VERCGSRGSYERSRRGLSRRRFRLHASVLFACLGLFASAAVPASAASAVSVLRGAHYGSRIFLDNVFTTGDRTQVTGRRVNFRQGIDYPAVGGVVQSACTSTDYSICDAFSQLNKLDGFDLQPRIVVPFTGAIDLSSVWPARQHQSGMARGPDRRPQQPRMPPLPGSADRPAAGAPALPGERRLLCAAIAQVT
jgi:hypothetical protein